MTTPSNQLPIPRPANDVVQSSTASSPVLRRMSEGLLMQARQTPLQRVRYRLGEYELCEPDYRLICMWAEDLAMAPEALLDVLALSRFDASKYFSLKLAPMQFVLADGALQSLVWDFDRLPRFPDLWVDGLRLHTLGFVWAEQTPNASLAPKVPGLRRLCISRTVFRSGRDKPSCILDLSGMPRLFELECGHFDLIELDLSPVPKLVKLRCGDNQLTELNLSPVPGLTELWHCANELTELDLSPVPGLTVLKCGGNLLTDLDLSQVPGMTELDCTDNELTNLDLSSVPGLTKLVCGVSYLTELDLSPVQGLTVLDCWGNRLTDLDLTPVPGLTKLSCPWNQLSMLDLAPVPGLNELNCAYNEITDLDLTPVPGLTKLSCHRNLLTVLDLAPVPGLTELKCDKDVIVLNAPSGLKILKKG